VNRNTVFGISHESEETMSKANVTAFIERVQNDKALEAQIHSTEDLLRLANEHGFPFTREEFSAAAASDELLADDLKNVAGGVCAF
jgi:predicted ribosomally synthesized peptide with nif11-like leader